MKWWAFAKQFPKYALVFGIIIGSTVLFAFWWLYHSHGKAHSPQHTAAELASIRERAAKAEALVDYLFLADDDLYEAKNGELLFKNWLHGDHPRRLFFDPQSKKILGQFEQGFARYGFDGTRETTMMMKTPPIFFDGFKKVVFAKEKNVWIADADWQNFRFTNERQVTTIDSFYEQHFGENVLLLTSKTLVVRNLNNLLRVNLDTGNVKPTRLPVTNIVKQRSPDSKWVAGVLNGQFYCDDVDAGEAKMISIGRIGISDFLWIGNDKCICLAGGKEIIVYDRLTSTLTDNASLPFPCFKIGEPSPDGRYIFAAGGRDGRNGVLVDLEKKTAAPVKGGTGITWVSNDTFAFSCDLPNSELRGTWLQKTASSKEERVSSHPYLAQRTAPLLLRRSTVSIAIYVTDGGIEMMEVDNKNAVLMSDFPSSASRLCKLLHWIVE